MLLRGGLLNILLKLAEKPAPVSSTFTIEILVAAVLATRLL
jgi:hypothetical protein